MMGDNQKKLIQLISYGSKACKQKVKSISKVMMNFWPVMTELSKPLVSGKPLQSQEPNKYKMEQVLKTSINIYKADTEMDMRIRKPDISKANTQRSALDLSKLVEELRNKVSYLKSSKTGVPKWKTQRPAVTLDNINSRTNHILDAILSAECKNSQLKRLEDLVQHLQIYPQGKPHALKVGAIKILLSLRRLTFDENTLQSIREASAALGHIDPPVMQGVRILSIDGGGMRGIAVIKMLEQLEKLTGRKVYELFDFVCGVSTGAIIACCMVPPLAMDMERIGQLYKELSVRVFKQSMIWGTSKLVWSHAYYDTALWEQILKENVGSTRLLETTRYFNTPKICAISTVVNNSRVMPFLFRNYSVPYLMKSEYQGSSSYTMFEAIRASAAAPTIFEEFRIGEVLHQDGGILVNNPTAVAVQESKALWPDEQPSCVVSCGTGRCDPVQTLYNIESVSKNPSSWKVIFDKILDSATDTEAVHTILNSLLPEDVYFRLNPHLTVSVSMDETNEEKLSMLENETDMYLRRNEEKFKIIAQKLLVPRSGFQKCQDYIREKVKIMHDSR